MARCRRSIDDVQSHRMRYKVAMPQDVLKTSSDAQMSLRIGKAVAVDGAVTARGFLGIGVMIATALLGSAAIVMAARSRPGRVRGQ